MSLTTDDLKQIRALLREEVQSGVEVAIVPMEAKIAGIYSDVKEIYSMLKKIGGRVTKLETATTGRQP